MNAYHAFELIRSQPIESLNLNVEEYRHIKTGAQHIHLASDNPENVFLVALRTVPQDSTGVAHILEHTALCGSKKYPVRDPFFMMIRRSLNTFMNAFTSSDWTAYPFASQNKKDFNNLLNVYLDAVFFSRLDELDFAQEGHRLEFAEADNPESPLEFKGVVFNEMKGAMSSVPSTLWHTLCHHLYPTTTYHYNSGGEPENIPDLSYQQLKSFYKSHYHPSNAIFMTFGDIPAKQLQQDFEELALNAFENNDQQISVPDEQRLTVPLAVEEDYAFDEEGSDQQKTHIILGWLLGKATDLESAMQAHLLNSILLDNSASPLQQALETTDLGTAPSPLCGLDDSQKEMCFVCGVEGSDPDKAQAVEDMILEVLRSVAENGVPQQQLEASLHQLELQQREITGDGYPYGLQLILTALNSATHRGDPIALLDLEPVLDKLRQDIQDPEFIKQLAKQLLLENPHRVRLTLKPNKQLSAQKVSAEEQRLADIKAQLSDSQKQQVIEQAQALRARQEQHDDDSVLPKVTRADVPSEMAYVAAHEHSTSPLQLTTYNAGTNGLVYQQLLCALPELNEQQLALLPLYTYCLSELGVGERDYLQTQLWQSGICGSISASVAARGTPDDPNALSANLILSSKGLANNQPAICDLMQQTLEQVRFDELPRLRELIAQLKARKEMSITGNGHALAMTAAASGIGISARLGHQWSGLESIRTLKLLDNQLNDRQQLANFAEQLQTLHQQLLAAPRQFLLIGEQDKLAAYQQTMAQHFSAPAEASFTPFTLANINKPVAELWKTSTQVNFCAKAYPTVPMNHPDAAALNVLGGFLRNGYLHRTIREQGGAYGGGAGQDNTTGAFRFFSYRDPRIEGTLNDFDQSITWLKETAHKDQPLEEAILGVISTIDKPGSPAGEAKSTFHAELYGRTREIRENFRNNVLAVTVADLQRVAETYLTEEQANTAIISNPDNAAVADQLQLEQQTL